SPWAGRRYGAVFLPRVGQEVIVAFEEGDPDQPIILGSVYNADLMPPYLLPDNRTQSGIQSRSVGPDPAAASSARPGAGALRASPAAGGAPGGSAAPAGGGAGGGSGWPPPPPPTVARLLKDQTPCNELAFEDKRGQEDVFFRAQKDFHRVVLND